MLIKVYLRWLIFNDWPAVSTLIRINPEFRNALKVLLSLGDVVWTNTILPILGLIFVQSTPVGVVAGVVGVLSLMASSEEEVFKGLLEAGYSELANLEYFLVDNPKYDLIRVKLPFLEYTVDGERIRFVTGKGVVTALQIKGGNWIPM